MSIGRGLLLALVLAAFWPGVAAGQAMPACQLTSDADGQVVTVAALGSPGGQAAGWHMCGCLYQVPKL